MSLFIPHIRPVTPLFHNVISTLFANCMTAIFSRNHDHGNILILGPLTPYKTLRFPGTYSSTDPNRSAYHEGPYVAYLCPAIPWRCINCRRSLCKVIFPFASKVHACGTHGCNISYDCSLDNQVLEDPNSVVSRYVQYETSSVVLSQGYGTFFLSRPILVVTT